MPNLEEAIRERAYHLWKVQGRTVWEKQNSRCLDDRFHKTSFMER